MQPAAVVVRAADEVRGAENVEVIEEVTEGAVTLVMAKPTHPLIW